METNGLQVVLDDSTGQILELNYPPVGTFLSTTPRSTGLTYDWTVTPAPDGRSTILKAVIHNVSGARIERIPGPDFYGVRATDTPNFMEVRMGLGTINPFAGEPFSIEYASGGQYEMNALRWVDYGSLKGGLSVFERKWQDDPRPNLLVERIAGQLNQLHMQWLNLVPLEAGASWTSEEYWLTPHTGGWAKGIEPYRAYVAGVNPRTQLPEHIRDGLGFLTLWMIEGPEPDPTHAAFRFTDIPRIASDTKAHGLDHVVLWGASGYARLPIPHEPRVGTKQELINGIQAAKSQGVDVAPFINVTQATVTAPAPAVQAAPGAPAVAKANYQFDFSIWLYHSELIPAIENPPRTPVDAQPPTGQGHVDLYTHPQELRDSMVDWANKGVSSFAWDVFQDDGTMKLVDTLTGIRNEIRAIDPKSSFGGEPAETNMERAALILDYTWNWMDYYEAGPYMNVLKTPRLNCNVSTSERVAKMAFADGLYLNVLAKAPNRQNGTLLISDAPVAAAAIDELVPRRAQFLPFFTEGVGIGECVLAEPACDFVRSHKADWIGGATVVLGKFEYPKVFVRGHVLGSKMLVIVLNNGNAQEAIHFKSDLSMWLPGANAYSVTYYDSAGTAGTVSTVLAADATPWDAATAPLNPLELAYFVVEKQEVAMSVWPPKILEDAVHAVIGRI